MHPTLQQIKYELGGRRWAEFETLVTDERTKNYARFNAMSDEAEKGIRLETQRNRGNTDYTNFLKVRYLEDMSNLADACREELSDVVRRHWVSMLEKENMLGEAWTHATPENKDAMLAELIEGEKGFGVAPTGDERGRQPPAPTGTGGIRKGRSNPVNNDTNGRRSRSRNRRERSRSRGGGRDRNRNASVGMTGNIGGGAGGSQGNARGTSNRGRVPHSRDALVIDNEQVGGGLFGEDPPWTNGAPRRKGNNGKPANTSHAFGTPPQLARNPSTLTSSTYDPIGSPLSRLEFLQSRSIEESNAAHLRSVSDDFYAMLEELKQDKDHANDPHIQTIFGKAQREFDVAVAAFEMEVKRAV